MTDASVAPPTAALPEAAVRSLVDAGRALVDAGLSPGSSGNLSVRLGDRIVMTGTGASLGALDAAALSILDADGTLVDGVRPSKEVPLHLAMYGRAPEHRAVVHVHSPFAVALSCLAPWSEESAIPPLTPYVIMRVGRVALVPYSRPGDTARSDAIRQLAASHGAILLANHGPVVAGADLGSAVAAAEELEETARLFFLLEGRPHRLLTAGQIDELRRVFGV